MKKLKGKTVLVTGSNRGIGQAVVRLFASEGAAVIACCRQPSEAFETWLADLGRKEEGAVYPVYFDMADEEAVKAGIKAVKALKIPVDILVNNAGVPHLALLGFTRMADVHRVFQVNYFAQLQLIQGLYPLLAKSEGGCIINMASAAGIDGEAGNAVYGATKASLILLTKVLSKEYAGAKIRVNALAPGLTQTDFAAAMGEKAKESMIEKASLHRLGEAEEIARAALFLASADASFITGQVLRVDGGMNG